MSDPQRTGRAPLVSIGMPVLNGERYLAAALESLLAQDMSDFELLVLDNASTDKTSNIARDFAGSDPRVRYLRRERRVGAAKNFNDVAQRARGRYFKWAAHDDICGPGFLSRCVAVLEGDPGVVLCYPRAEEIDDLGAVTRAFPPAVYARESRPSERARSYLSVRTACLEAYGVMRDETLRTTRMIGPYTSSDRVFLLELALRGRFEQVPQVEFFCRTHPGRSLERYRGSSDRQQWFAAPDAPAQWLPRWRLGLEFGRAILRAPITPAERLRCAPFLAGWFASNWQQLGRQLGAAPVRFVRRQRAARARGRTQAPTRRSAG